MTDFPQFRTDPITGRRVLIAPERALRGSDGPCPFCEGREAETPPEILALRDGSPPNSPGWRVRVVPNRFPAVRPTAPASGSHELIIECPNHVASISDLPVERVAIVLGVVRDRFRELRKTWGYAQYFKNHGAAAGASLAHAHSQIIAMAAPPPALVEELFTGPCPFCALIERELADGSRMVMSTPNLVAFTAFAGRFPYETWVLPRRHARHFEELSTDELHDLAAMLHTIVGRLESVAGAPAYNWVLHTAPWCDDRDFHWHFVILPRMSGIAGFELGAGIFINPVAPEVAAARLTPPIAIGELAMGG